MKKLPFYTLILLSLVTCHLFAQHLPVIKAGSKNVKIRDGEIFKENYWVIFPETNPDIYWVEFPRKDHKVTFITDQDSISFDIKYGSHYDFIVLLNGKDSCHTRISATYPKNITPSRSVSIDTIPFTMKDNRIYVQGNVNGSKNLTFQFDLGAGGIGLVCINQKSVKKVKLNFDKTTTLVNSDGQNEVNMSSINTLQIGKSTWHNIEIVETKNMDKHEDVLFGCGLFLDKYLEVDYDKKLLIVHENLPSIDSGFKKYPIQVNQNVCPEIMASFEIDGLKYTDWFGFDTGNTGNGIINSYFLTKNNLFNKFSKIVSFRNRTIARIPTLHVAGQTFNKGLIVLEKGKKSTSLNNGGGVLGNKLLKKFNFIIDRQNGFIYLKPNFL